MSGEPDVLLNDPNRTLAGSRDYLDHLDHSRPLYLPGYVRAVLACVNGLNFCYVLILANDPCRSRTKQAEETLLSTLRMTDTHLEF